MLTQLEKLRYLKPVTKIVENWVGASIVSFFSVVWSYLVNIFTTELELILLLFVAIVFDLLTGIYASKFKKKIRISSLGLRQTVVKVLEYSPVLLLFIGISNVYESERFFGKIVQNIDSFAFFFFTWIEVKSIGENLGNKTISKLIERLKEKISHDGVS